MLETAKLAAEDPEAVRQFAKTCDEPLKSHLLRIVNNTESNNE
jgi:hypothetical protein